MPRLAAGKSVTLFQSRKDKFYMLDEFLKIGLQKSGNAEMSLLFLTCLREVKQEGQMKQWLILWSC